jgi:hypothetical protein
VDQQPWIERALVYLTHKLQLRRDADLRTILVGVTSVYEDLTLTAQRETVCRW